MKIVVFNGMAASPRAWELVRFPAPPRIVSYVEPDPDDLFVDEEKTLLAGWSMGGSRALECACRRPDRVSGLVLVAAAARMLEDRATGWQGMSRRRLEAFRKAIDLTQGEGLFGPPAGVPNPYAADTPEHLDHGFRYLEQIDLRAPLERTFGGKPPLFPVAIFQSEKDGIVRPGNAAYLKTVFPHASLVWVPGGEHALPTFAPDAISRAIASVFAA
ncbi:MAG: alpha/beta hydrolase [Kiritimatiellae bacterium]|nr:alpha/beta hydrolase [Kiritimatiellia bacterium]